MIRVGVDLVEIKRIKKLIKKRRFINKIFTPEEINYCSSHSNPHQHYAVRLAAKEAVWKALAKKNVFHKDISIFNDKDGRPVVRLKKIYRIKVDLSLSHTNDYALACAIVYEKK